MTTTSINDTGGHIFPEVFIDTNGKLPLLSTTSAANSQGLQWRQCHCLWWQIWSVFHLCKRNNQFFLDQLDRKNQKLVILRRQICCDLEQSLHIETLSLYQNSNARGPSFLLTSYFVPLAATANTARSATIATKRGRSFLDLKRKIKCQIKTNVFLFSYKGIDLNNRKTPKTADVST